MAETEVPTKYPPRRCGSLTLDGLECLSMAMAFIDTPVCGVHGTEEQREANRRCWDAYIAASLDDDDPPDDVIVAAEEGNVFSVRFGFRPDAVMALRKIAGAKYRGDDKAWVFPMHRMEKVAKTLERFFSEIVFDSVTEERHCLDWQEHEAHRWTVTYFCSGKEV